MALIQDDSGDNWQKGKELTLRRNVAIGGRVGTRLKIITLKKAMEDRKQTNGSVRKGNRTGDESTSKRRRQQLDHPY